MNLTISKEQLINGLQAVQNVVSTRTTLPILSNVLIRAEGNRLEFTATDLDVTISCGVEAAVKEGGATTVPVKKLFGIVRELNNPEIEIEVDEKNTCSIRSGSSFYKINGLSADEFPPLPKFKEDKKVTLPQEKVKGMMKKTSFAISTDESRYVLNGIFISLKEHKLTMVATDGRRLALVDEEVDVTEKSQGEFIVPAKAVNELNRLLTDKGEVEIRYSENQAAFTLKDEKGFSILIISKLIEGNYPNYRQVIPGEAKERIALVREEFLHALKRAEIMTSEKSNSVKLTFSKNNLAITANSPEVGEARESLAINYKGKEMAIAFNPKYVIDPLNALSNDEIFLELIDELSPGVVKINGPFLYVVMPMRLS
ncbi:DNA polymerase III subunit beta [Pedosphaera parvula]|uniref:Beta sliding clamp n=1 Tax=Pedosphaera parvula (strain Ellin514) TaxID=320771 RepID=B9XEB7_PEDPL|nr:DNA polymerase III subunit beta [Pedosphaera parvula]EEF61631.1 DNA polymerase III, beta subunit [Pedosphaera parvula Ellin514]